MTDQVTVHEAKTQLSKLLARVERGEEIVIARGSVPVAKLVRATGQVPIFGFDAGLEGYDIPEDFNEMSQEEIDEFEQGDLEI
jgi:prevent-host-death family protein